MMVKFEAIHKLFSGWKFMGKVNLHSKGNVKIEICSTCVLVLVPGQIAIDLPVYQAVPPLV